MSRPSVMSLGSSSIRLSPRAHWTEITAATSDLGYVIPIISFGIPFDELHRKNIRPL